MGVQLVSENGQSVADVCRLLGENRATVLHWVKVFADHLSGTANPPRGHPRSFTANDLQVLAFAADRLSGGDATAEEVRELLSSGEHHADEHRIQWSYKNTPLFGDPPDGIHEDSYGAVFGGMASRRGVDVARSYWSAAKALLTSCERDPVELDFPTLFLVRHTVELYLKALLRNPPEHHDLERLIQLVENQHGKAIAPWIGARLRDFHRLDRMSDYFRYGCEFADGEYWVDFNHLRVVMERMIEAFEQVLRDR